MSERLTGDKKFYDELINVAAELGKNANGIQIIAETIEQLSNDENIVSLSDK